MASPTNLNEYYTGLGQALPTLEARGQLYQTAGLGTSADYIAQNRAGITAPNAALLGYLQKTPTGGTPPINSDTTKPETPIVPTSPVPTTPVPAPTPETPETPALTPAQTKLQSQIEEIQRQNTEAAGRTTYQEQQEQAAGIPGLTTLARDLSNQLKQAQQEAAIIYADPNQSGQSRGISQAQADREKNEALRQNSIKSNLINAQFQIAQGNLQSAQDSADRATNLKYAPIEASIKAAKENLDLIINSPEYTTQEKAQARAEQAKQDAKQEALTVSKNITSTITNLLLDPELQANAPPSVKKQLSDLALKPTLTQADAVFAANLAAQYKVKQTGTGVDRNRMLSISEAKDLGVPFGTTVGQAIDKGLISGGATKEAVATLTDKIGLIDNLISAPGFDSRVGPNSTARRGYAIADAFGAGQDFASGVQQLVNKETVDTLLALKAKGGTLGALSDQERLLLQNAATKIAGWEVWKKDGKVVPAGTQGGVPVGEWNISESAFKKELETIKSLTKRAIVNHLGYDPTTVSANDQAEIESIYVGLNNSSSTGFNPGAFY